MEQVRHHQKRFRHLLRVFRQGHAEQLVQRIDRINWVAGLLVQAGAGARKFFSMPSVRLR
jgi:hypothetical protein